jgi:hypothetical protein
VSKRGSHKESPPHFPLGKQYSRRTRQTGHSLRNSNALKMLVNKKTEITKNDLEGTKRNPGIQKCTTKTYRLGTLKGSSFFAVGSSIQAGT